MKASIIIPAFDKPDSLRQVLGSIRAQRPPCDYEIVVVDDGPNRQTEKAAKTFAVEHYLATGNTEPRNPAAAYNHGFRAARGEVLIVTKDDVVHHTKDAIERLVALLTPDTFVLATVCNVTRLTQQRTRTYVAPEPQDRRRPLMFLGAVLRKHVYAVGGCEEEFGQWLGFDDNYLAACLFGRGLTPFYTDKVVGHHLEHARLADLESVHYVEAKKIYDRRLAECAAMNIAPIASGGPWEWVE